MVGHKTRVITSQHRMWKYCDPQYVHHSSESQKDGPNKRQAQTIRRLEKSLGDRKLMLTLEYKFSVTVVILSVHAQAHVAYRYLVCFTAVQGTHFHQLTHHLHACQVLCPRAHLCGKRNKCWMWLCTPTILHDNLACVKAGLVDHPDHQKCKRIELGIIRMSFFAHTQ